MDTNPQHPLGLNHRLRNCRANAAFLSLRVVRLPSDRAGNGGPAIISSLWLGRFHLRGIETTGAGAAP